MNKFKYYDTLSQATKGLKEAGYTEDFTTENQLIKGLQSGKKCQPEKAHILKTFRFEGMSNPSDSSALLVIETEDGLKGTMVMAFGSKHSQELNIIHRMKKVEELT